MYEKKTFRKEILDDAVCLKNIPFRRILLNGWIDSHVASDPPPPRFKLLPCLLLNRINSIFSTQFTL